MYSGTEVTFFSDIVSITVGREDNRIMQPLMVNSEITMMTGARGGQGVSSKHNYVRSVIFQDRLKSPTNRVYCMAWDRDLWTDLKCETDSVNLDLQRLSVNCSCITPNSPHKVTVAVLEESITDGHDYLDTKEDRYFNIYRYTNCWLLDFPEKIQHPHKAGAYSIIIQVRAELHKPKKKKKSVNLVVWPGLCSSTLDWPTTTSRSWLNNVLCPGFWWRRFYAALPNLQNKLFRFLRFMFIKMSLFFSFIFSICSSVSLVLLLLTSGCLTLLNTRRKTSIKIHRNIVLAVLGIQILILIVVLANTQLTSLTFLCTFITMALHYGR